MIRTTKITLVSAVLAVALIGYGVISLAKAQEDITITEQVLVGDVSVVEGMTMHLNTYMDNAHYWNIEVPLGRTEESQVTYELAGTELRYDGEVQGIFHVYSATGFGMSTNHSFDWEEETEELFQEYDMYPLLAMIDVGSRAPSGERYTETILYSDYYDYYPTQIEEQLITINENGIYYTFTEEAIEILRAFFRFPVVEGDQIQITVEKDSADNTYSYEGNGVSDIRLITNSVVEEDGIYVAMQTIEDGGEEITTLTETKLYYIPLIPEGDEMGIGEIEYLMTFPQSVYIPCFEDGGDVLLLLIQEGDKTYLSTRSKSDFHEIQNIMIPSGGSWMYQLEDAILIENIENQYTILTLEEGEYSLAFDGNYEEEILVDYEENMYIYSQEYAYNDGIFMVIQEWRTNVAGLGSVYVTCYDDSGRIYAGVYHSTQEEEAPQILYNNQVRFNERIWMSFAE